MTVPPAEEVRVDYGTIEKSLAELWRGEHALGEDAVTRAALWNVIAHTWKAQRHTFASQVLNRVAAAVPQRTIVVRAEPDAPDDIASWISANCHMVGGEKQICSEEVAIVAGGRFVNRVPPLVNALLIPDMPVAVWWLGHLPTTEHENRLLGDVRDKAVKNVARERRARFEAAREHAAMAVDAAVSGTEEDRPTSRPH